MEPLYLAQTWPILVLFASGAVFGTLISLVTKWGLTRFALELDYRLSDLEARLSREVKVRAQSNSVKSRNENTSLDEWAKQQTIQQPFATNFDQYRRQKMTS